MAGRAARFHCSDRALLFRKRLKTGSVVEVGEEEYIRRELFLDFLFRTAAGRKTECGNRNCDRAQETGSAPGHKAHLLSGEDKYDEPVQLAVTEGHQYKKCVFGRKGFSLFFSSDTVFESREGQKNQMIRAMENALTTVFLFVISNIL
ncbi:MAG: hypothetical protein OXR72_07685 [Gemmatimonadota bacterium]|nr:hypothetical protein [Gemmatimonadota bacterium]